MTEHLSTSQIEHFCLSTLPEEQLQTLTPHVADCDSCLHQFTQTLRQQRGSAPFSFTLDPEFWFRHDHVDFEQIVGIADDNLDATIREIINIHLKICQTCREDVRAFLAFRNESARDVEVSFGPTAYIPNTESFSCTPWWQSFRWKPSYTAAAVLAAVALVFMALAIRWTSDLLQANDNDPGQIAQASPAPTASNVVTVPTPSVPYPSKSPDVTPSPAAIDNSLTVAVLKDGRGEVIIDKSGRVTGLDDISSITRQEIAQAVLNERLGNPKVLNDLAGPGGGLRGGTKGEPSFKLVYPTRRVIIEDRPVFKWESLAAASSYRVYVLDSRGTEIAKSEELSPNSRQWTAKRSLQRGETFSWVVTAVVDGKEIISPSASAPEVRFAVLATKDKQELNQLKKTGSHLGLGIFYARTGLLIESERELEQLVQLNPQSRLPKKLLRSVRSLRNSK